MDIVYPQALFSTPGMVTVFVIVIILEALSLGYFCITIVEFKMLQHKHNAFLRAIGGEDVHREKSSRVVFWSYVVATIAVTIVTSILFVFQPHII